MTVMDLRQQDNAFFARLTGLCNKHDCGVSKSILEQMESLKNRPTCHCWLTMANFLAYFEMEYNESVHDLIRYAENRSKCV